MSWPIASCAAMPVSRAAARLNTMIRPAWSAMTRPSGRSSGQTTPTGQRPGWHAGQRGRPVGHEPVHQTAASVRPSGFAVLCWVLHP